MAPCNWCKMMKMKELRNSSPNLQRLCSALKKICAPMQYMVDKFSNLPYIVTHHVVSAHQRGFRE